MTHHTRYMDHVMTHGHEREEGSLWDKKKKIKEGERRKGHVSRRRRVGRWEEISHLDQIGEREGEEEKENEGRENESMGEKEKERGRGKKRISRCSDGQSLTVRELKLVHTAGATRGYQN